MPVLIVDNYDSFTYNLVDAVAKVSGCAPIVIRNDEMTWDEIQRLDFDSVVISPSPTQAEPRALLGVPASG